MSENRVVMITLHNVYMRRKKIENAKGTRTQESEEERKNTSTIAQSLEDTRYKSNKEKNINHELMKLCVYGYFL